MDGITINKSRGDLFQKWVEWSGINKDQLADVGMMAKVLASCFDFQQNKIDDLTEQLNQQKFNNEHNLSIDQKVSERINDLTEQNKILREALLEVGAMSHKSKKVYDWYCKNSEKLKEGE